MLEEKVTYCTLRPGNGNVTVLRGAVRKGDLSKGEGRGREGLKLST